MPESAPTHTGGAVFLSYAREDSEAARRIADALRAFGVEVWFDLNELRGGDAWDGKIKKEIRECALFVPIISATTQARAEGYFRREWKFGVERTHDMAASRIFLLPVVLDDIAPSEADVPEEFLRIQWTRLPHGVPSPEFVGQVKRILESPRGVQMAARSGSSVSPVGRDIAVPAVAGSSAAARRPGAARYVVIGAGAVVLIGGAVALLTLRHNPGSQPPAVSASRGSVVAPPPASNVARPDEKSVAVLPFENMSEEKDSGFFADGIHEDVLTNLAYIRDLHVVSRTSVMQYRGTTKPIRQIAQELNVAYILEGSVRRAGNKVRVTGQLIKAATDEHVWAKAYDRDVSDIFAVQEDLAREIANAMSTVLSPEEKTLLARRPTDNLEAYDAYVKARRLRDSGIPNNLNEAVAALEHAVQLDPAFAQAWAELGALHAYLYFNEYDQTDDRLAKSKRAIDTAIRLAPNDPGVIENIGDYYYYGYRDYERAVEYYERLAVMRPNDAEVARSLGLIHRRQGRWPEALAELRRSAQLEPHNASFSRNLYQLEAALRLYDEAEATHRHVLALTDNAFTEEAVRQIDRFNATGSLSDVEQWLAHLPTSAAEEAQTLAIRKGSAAVLGRFAEYVALDRQHRYVDAFGQSHGVQDTNSAIILAAAGDRSAARTRAQEAITELNAEIEKQPANAGLWSNIGLANAILGNRDEALRAAKKGMDLVPESRDAIAGPSYRGAYGTCLAWLGDKDAAVAEFEHLLHTPYGENIYVAKYGPAWFPLRGNPRFEALVNDPKNNAPFL